MNLIISYYDFVSVWNIARHSIHRNKFLVATNGLILYVVSWQATRSILPPLYRAPAHSSVQTHRTTVVDLGKIQRLQKLGINFSQPLYTCMYMQNSSLFLSRDQTRIRTRQDFHSFRMAKMFSMKIPTILMCITWHGGTFSCLSPFDQLSFHRGNTVRGAGGRVYC